METTAEIDIFQQQTMAPRFWNWFFDFDSALQSPVSPLEMQAHLGPFLMTHFIKRFIHTRNLLAPKHDQLEVTQFILPPHDIM